MTIKAGQILTVGGETVIKRIQSATPNLNIPEERIYETGNYETVSIVRDTPDLSFDVTSLDVTTQFEALCCNTDPDTVNDGDFFDLGLDSVPFDIISPWKTKNAFTALTGHALPYLTLESATYRFGVGQNSEESFTLRGDSIYYCQGGSPRYETYAGAGATTYNFANTPAIKTVEQGNNIFAYCVSVVFSDGTYKRLFFGDDYTNTSGGFTILDAANAPGGSTLHVVYAAGTSTYLQTVHDTVAVSPAAVRGRDIQVWVSDGAATPQLVRFRGLQSAELNWRLNLDATQELGNPHYVSRDYDSADLTGNLVMRAADIDYFMDRVAQIAGVSGTDTVNALSQVELEMQVKILHPDTGDVLKTFVVDDAKFTPPAPNVQANTRLESQLPFSSSSGTLLVYKGEPA